MSTEAERATRRRREFTYAVLLGVVGAGLALYAVTRIWSVEVTPRPPLPPIRQTHTGSSLLPWLSALALVGLAGAGAVLATRGVLRRLIGVLLLLIAVGLAIGGGYGVVAVDRGDGSAAWPVLCALGGVLAAVGAVLTTVRGPSWPVMGARYERPAGAGAAGARTSSDAGDGPGRAAGGVDSRRTLQAWDALDRGEDPTLTDSTEPRRRD